MPALKQLTCTIQWAPTNVPFTEYGKMYGDGVVESFICVPSNVPKNFAVHLRSKGFIFEGLAMVVFIDGQYHVNRNRINLVPPETLPNDRAKDTRSVVAAGRRSEVEFIVRQKEKSHGDGLYMGRSWRFDDHNLVDEDQDGREDRYQQLEEHFNHLGMIEVVVLRCRAKRSVPTDSDDLSSAGDSDLMERWKEPTSPPGTQEPPAVWTSRKENIDNAASAPEPDTIGGLFGLFDGAADHCARRLAQVDGPSLGHENCPQHPPGGPHYVPSQEQHQLPPRGRPPQVHFNLPQAPSIHRSSPVHSIYGHSSFQPQNERYHLHDPSLLGRFNPTTEPYDSGHGGQYQPSSLKPSQSPNLGSIPRIHGPYDMPHWPTPYMMMNPPMPGNLPPSRLPTYSGYAAQPFKHLPPFQSSQHVPHGFPPFPPYVPLPYLIPTPHGMLDPRTDTIVLPTSIIPPYAVNGPSSPNGFNQTTNGQATASGDNSAPGQSQDPTHNGSSINNGQIWDQNNTRPDNTVNATQGDSNGTWQVQNNNNTAEDQKDSDGWASDANGTPAKNNHDSNGQNGTSNDWLNDTNNGQQHTANDSWENDTSNVQKTAANDDWSNDTSDKQHQQKHSTIPQPAPPPPLVTYSDPAAQTSAGKRTMYGPYGPWEAAEDLASQGPQPDAPEEPRYDVPRWYAEEIMSSKQVVSGPGFLYYKKSRAPEYIDSLSEPYARFIFKYRTKDELKNDFNIDVEAEQVPHQPSHELAGLDKQVLIDHIAMYEQKFGRLSSPERKPPKPVVKESQKYAHGPAPPDRDFLEYDIPEARPTVGKTNARPEPTSTGNAKNTAKGRAEPVEAVPKQNPGFDFDSPPPPAPPPRAPNW